MGVPNHTKYWLNKSTSSLGDDKKISRAGNQCNIFRDSYVTGILENYHYYFIRRFDLSYVFTPKDLSLLLPELTKTQKSNYLQK